MRITTLLILVFIGSCATTQDDANRDYILEEYPELSEDDSKVKETVEECRKYVFPDEIDELSNAQNMWMRSRSKECQDAKKTINCYHSLYEKRVDFLRSTCGLVLDYNIQEREPDRIYSYRPLCSGTPCKGASGKMELWHRSEEKIFINAMTKYNGVDCDCHLEARKVSPNTYSLRFDRLEPFGQGSMTLNDKGANLKTNVSRCCHKKATINGEWKFSK